MKGSTKFSCFLFYYPLEYDSYEGVVFCRLIIGPFADDVAGTGFGFHINFSDILPDNTEGKQLCATEKADDGND